MKKKTTIIIVIAIFVVLALGIVIKIGLDYRKEDKIRKEVKEISLVFETKNDSSSLNEILDRRIINGGQYETIEDAIKTYYKTLYNSLNNLEFLLDDDNFINYLSAKNMKEDGPKFLKSREMLRNSKAQIEEHYVTYKNMLEDDFTKQEFLEEKKVDIYYRNFFLELTTLGLNAQVREEKKNDYERVIHNIDVYIEIFDFLAAHENMWSVKNEVITFTETGLYEEYVNLTKKLNQEVKEEVEKVS